MELRFEVLKDYVEMVKNRITKNEDFGFKFSKDVVNSIKDRIEGKNKELIWDYILEGLSLIEKIKNEKEFYENNKEMALETLKIGQQLQSDIKKEIGNFVIQGKNNIVKELQDFNYKLFEEIGFLRNFEEKEKIEEIEISLTPNQLKKQKEEEKKEIKKRERLIRKAMADSDIKRVKKEKRKIGKEILFIVLFFVIIGALYTFLTIKKTKPVEYDFKISDFQELPQESKIERGNYNLKITIPEYFWEDLNKKKKMEIVNIVAGKADEKGYLMLEFFSNKGEKLAKWIKNERTYIFK